MMPKSVLKGIKKPKMGNTSTAKGGTKMPKGMPMKGGKKGC